MTVSLPFTLTTLSDAPPDSFAAQQYRAANGYEATERTASGTSSTSSASNSEEDDDEDDFAGALATAMNMASNVSSNPVMPQAASSASATSSGAVSASAVSPVMPQTTATAQQSAAGEASGVSAAAVMPGMTPASNVTGELTAEGVASAVVPDASQTLAVTTNTTTTDLSSELTPLRILMLQRFRIPVANTAGENATMQDVTQVSIVSTDARIAADDTAALIKATQSVLNNGLPADFVSASAIIMPNPDEVTMELAEELVDAE